MFKLLFGFMFFLSTLHAQESWIAWDSSEGLARLQHSRYKENFWKIARFYESQTRLTYCGIACAIVVLNALSIQPPPSQFLGSYLLFTQEEFFSQEVQQVIDKQLVDKRGITLDELTSVLNLFSVYITQYSAECFSEKEMRKIIISALKRPNQLVMALYSRKAVGQIGTGHWSPIAAYDAYSDSFLIMDVAKFKYPPSWVDASTFLRAMQTHDIYGPYGWLIVEKRT